MVTTKVLDFGISLMVERVIDPSAGQTPTMAMGTPSYMAPEHILGAGQIDGRVDVYGFGVLLYEALTGQTPFPGEPGPDLFQRILNETAPRVTLFRPDLPDGLVRIIETAMAKRPDDRFSDLNLMVSAVEDEILPPTPMPRLLTPLAGVSSLVARDTPAEPVVLAVAKREPSGQYQETILYGAPLWEKQNGAANSGSRPGPELVPLPPSPARATMLAAPRPSLLKVPFSGLRALFTPRGLRGLAGVGLAVALACGVWMAVHRKGQVPAAPVVNPTPTASGSAPSLPVPVVEELTTDTSVPAPEPVVAPPSPPAVAAFATGEHSGHSGHAHGGPVPAMRGRMRLAARDTWKGPPPRKQAASGFCAWVSLGARSAPARGWCTGAQADAARWQAV